MKLPAPTPYPELNVVLAGFVASVEAILGGTLVAAYLQGSFAVGDFDIDSDVDFLIVTEGGLSDFHVRALNAMHARIYASDSIWAKHLEGSYFPMALINCPYGVSAAHQVRLQGPTVLREMKVRGPAVEPLWYLDNMSTSLVRSVHDNTLVVRWVVREHGISLLGPDPKSLFDPVPVAALRAEVLRTMRDWGRHLLANPDDLNNRWCQPYAVLSYCRMLQTLETGTIQSKRAGAIWGIDTLDSRWYGLIERAWTERAGTRFAIKVRQPADPDDLASTLEFIGQALKCIP